MNKITTKIILLAFGMSLFVGIVSGLVLLYSLKQTNNTNLELLEQNLRSNFDLTAKEQVETTISLIKAINDMPENDSFGVEEKKKLAADLTRELRYGKDGYFWIDNENGVNVALLGQDIEGKSRYDMQDSRGSYFIREIIKNGMQPGGGYTNYFFPKKGSDVSLPKRSYSLAYKNFNWVIGTGNYVDDIDNLVDSYHQQANKALNRTLIIMSLIILGLLLLSFVLATVLGKRMSAPIVSISGKMKEISQGNLMIDIDSTQNDEIGELAKATRNMIDKLRNMIGHISKGSDEILNASDQMSESSQQLSQGASEQAASTEEVSASMEQMVSNIQQNALNSQETEKISQSASEGIKKVTQRSNESLMAIRSITDKISVINDIAGRAGEHGKGFAVVAAEVRKLAEMSANAAVEIVKLSNNSLTLAEEAVNILETVLPEIDKTNQLVLEIAAASNEQNDGADQINSAIQQLNSVTQQNAAASEQLASSSEELSAQAENLKEIISFFKA
jgi:methyl-accepting chemotaxis protein